MQYVADAGEAKEIDRISIQELGIPSVVLMEKAALAVAGCVMAGNSLAAKVLAVCGMGNNGGDGVAAARLLWEKGYEVQILLLGDREKASPDMETQLKIAENLEIRISTSFPEEEYDVILDAIFGIGLSREVGGSYAQAVQWINRQKARVYAVDIPSGVCASTGKILGTAVQAEQTITFGVNKRGLLLYPGCSCCGQISVVDIGFPGKAVEKAAPSAFTLTWEEAKAGLPVRRLRTNKGSYGRVLVIAGSPQMSGACYFTAAAAYRMGCGLVKLLTSQENRKVLQACLPEAIVGAYAQEDLQEELEWADVVAIGPGLGCSDLAKELVMQVLKVRNKSVVIDGDGLNLLAAHLQGKGLQLPGNFILTPHMKEMSRLVQVDVPTLQEQMIEQALLALSPKAPDGKEECPVLVLKDARTIVTDGRQVYINTTGNNGLATGGSGDVLAGMIAGLAAQGAPPVHAAVLGVCLHGEASEKYLEEGSRYSMMASDILKVLPSILPK